MKFYVFKTENMWIVVGLCRHVVLYVVTKVSDEYIASIFGVICV